MSIYGPTNHANCKKVALQYCGGSAVYVYANCMSAPKWAPASPHMHEAGSAKKGLRAAKKVARKLAAEAAALCAKRFPKRSKRRK